MALFIMIVRKMVKNKWLVASLFAGLLISVALVSSMPIFTEAILSRMLVKDMEALQLKTNIYPGSQYYKMLFMKEAPEKRSRIFDDMNRYMQEDAADGFQIPVTELVADIQTDPIKIRPEHDPYPGTTKSLQTMTLRSFAELEDHIELIDGRMPADEPADGVYEVLVTRRGLVRFNTVLDSVFIIDDEQLNSEIKLKPVGIFEKKQDDDPYFKESDLASLSGSFIVTDKLARKYFLEEGSIPVASVGWFFVLDYSKLELQYLDDFLHTSEQIRSAMLKKVTMYQTSWEIPAMETVAAFTKKAEHLKTVIWSLHAPVLIMLAFYMFMVSNLIANRQKNEIAVIRSRGAARWQVIASYAVEGALLCSIALVAGPLLGLVFTELLGASNGFLEFVQRVRLPVRLSTEAYRYGAMASGACFVVMLIPIVVANRFTIVGHKQQLSRRQAALFWHKAFLDVIAVAVAMYGLYTFKKRLNDLQSLGLQTDALSIEPLQFIVPALFILGSGLLLLRLYPWVLTLIYWIGKKWWPPTVYATLIQVGRSTGQYQFLMMFLIMTIATGVFSATAARTINTNAEEQIRYKNGSDIVLASQWIDDKPVQGVSIPSGSSGPPGAMPASAGIQAPVTVHYLEPPYEPYTTLEGVGHTAKVFRKEASFNVGNEGGTATLMGIDTDEFGETAWFRDSLLDYSINDYLNLIAPDPKAVLVSSTLAEQKKVKPGDTIWIGWTGVPQQPFQVYGIIDYFPAFNPTVAANQTGNSRKAEEASAPMLIVGHLSRIQLQLALEPYEVWIRLKADASVAELYQGMAERKLPITKVVNTKEELADLKNDPFMMALNGILTLGFVLSIMISFIGLLLYWILSLQGRALQNGILRAVGLSLRQLVRMIALEQLLTSGVAVMIGIVVGNAASLLYVPNFQIAFRAARVVPPFQITVDAADLMRIYVLVGCMLLLGLGILAWMLSRLRIHQAIKLGED
ncbi:ABC transporter permease [Paenibacillus thermotolerans]|uniref:ABC transporter permease n=1 Tax=Paenibacillus thermotolerans TaxID=3027807 RepID=UPI002368DC49|nr:MULTISPECIES: ABC transporter permease [unclassified Paenibacillus]